LSGGVALHFIPSLASPPRLSGTECNSAEPTHSIAGASAAGCCPAGAEGCTQTLRCDTSNCTSCVSGGAPRLECVPGDGVCPPDARFCCAPRLTCTVPSAESSLAECSDGCDNDGDGAVDCADSGCAPTACASPCSTLASTCADYSPAEIRECAQTPSLPGPTSLGSLPGLGGIVDEVVLSLGDASETELSLGIAWLETSGASTIVAFRQVLLGLDAGGQPSEILEAGAPVQVSIEARVPSRPALLHVDTGMLESGLERGASIVDPAGRGGWYVVWSQRLVDLSFEVVGRRVSEHDGRPVDADCSGGSCAELLVLSQPTPDNTVDARLPRLFDEGGAPYLLYFDRDAQALVGGFLQAPSP
ncbi:MAG: hypothetical protein OEY14_11100, partial [Myxococcales bacterium]|nr:hypothetical protein [Myxococcales bacterium]